MKLNNSEINFYVDTLIVEALLADTNLSKTAQAGTTVSEITNKVKDYFGNQIDPNDRAGSLLTMLAPGGLSLAFKAMGFGWLGLLFALLVRVFHIDVGAILKSIYNKLKGTLSNDKKVTSAEIDAIVSGSVQEQVKPSTEEEVEESKDLLESKNSPIELLRDARMLKLAMIEFDKNQFNKVASISSYLFNLFNSRKSEKVSVLSRLLSWIFKIAIASAGLMVAGDVINKYLGRPNALDGSMQKGKVVTAPVMSVSTQTKFKIQPNYRDVAQNSGDTIWDEDISNNKSSIESMLLNFTKQVYQGLDGLDSIIMSTPGFQVIADKIAFYNHESEGGNKVYIPKYFTSKQQIVDMFIDDVAEKAK
jgi:hypothetical protein